MLVIMQEDKKLDCVCKVYIAKHWQIIFVFFDSFLKRKHRIALASNSMYIQVFKQLISFYQAHTFRLEAISVLFYSKTNERVGNCRTHFNLTILLGQVLKKCENILQMSNRKLHSISPNLSLLDTNITEKFVKFGFPGFEILKIPFYLSNIHKI